MDVREKLVELLNEKQYHGMAPWAHGMQSIGNEEIADHLIANGVTVQECISVDDRLPEEKANCIVYYQHSYCDNDGYWAIGMCFYDGEKFQLNPAYKVTHWMLLPEPPKGE